MIIDRLEEAPLGVILLSLVLGLDGTVSLYQSITGIGIGGSPFEWLGGVLGPVVTLTVVIGLLSLHPLGWLIAVAYFTLLAFGILLVNIAYGLPPVGIVIPILVLFYLMWVNERYGDPVDWGSHQIRRIGNAVRR
ncbi:hypothetical protein C495_03187 [Natronorubrum sulfidifaciens JCM 14089]|uniref:DoxX family protein n=1 Tax=Natronorubrum sulfidifaciens JCM 14089 TaxID=1230460 RepID=L9WCN2_9EURY|nr:hypothetical protein C495_03187 [Natronorubrum sulfidifaciens JCM 14089]